MVSKDTDIEGLYFSPRGDDTPQIYTFSFYIIRKHTYECIDCCMTGSPDITDAEIYVLLKSRGYAEEKIQTVLSSRDYYNDKNISHLLTEYIGKKEEDRLKTEAANFVAWRRKIGRFLGIGEETAWILFFGTTVFFIKNNERNAKCLETLFNERITKCHLDRELFMLIASYGTYRHTVIATRNLIGSMKNRSAMDIHAVFHTNDFKLEESGEAVNGVDSIESEILCNYYRLYWRNRILLWDWPEGKTMAYRDFMLETLLVKDSIKKSTETTSNSKLKLLLSDEILITDYALTAFNLASRADEMMALAEETLALCLEYNHTEGYNLRDFLLNDDMPIYGDEGKMRVAQFAKSYVWL
jgi:hypothetical protein